MNKLRRFEDMEVWKSARNLAKDIYAVSKKPLFLHDYSLRDQIRRAAISIISNIAEGSDSQSNPAFIRYLASARGSTAEVRTQLYLAIDFGYISSAECASLVSQTECIGRQLTGFILYLKKAPSKQ
jgi:four helix bundle protein